MSYFTSRRDNKSSGFDTASDSSEDESSIKKKEDDDLTVKQIQKQISQYQLEKEPLQKEPGMNLLSMEVRMEDDADSGSGISDDKDVGPSKASKRENKMREKCRKSRKMYKFNQKNMYFRSSILPFAQSKYTVGINQIADQTKNLMLQDENMYFEEFQTPSSSH